MMTLTNPRIPCESLFAQQAF